MMLKVAKLGIAIAAVLAWIVPAAYAGVPDVANSFYVPQRGSVGTPQEGATALLSFRVCPNNDAGTALAANARIKVVVRDVNGTGIVGIAPADICMLFNGGTAAQGFSGVGADSVLECVGTRESMMQAIHSTRPGGSISYVGVPHGVELDGAQLFYTHVHLHGGPAPVRRYLPALIQLVQNGTIDPGKVFDLELPLGQAAEGYRAMDERRAIKTLLRP